MESQIAGLEVRMQRREKELMTAVEDAKSAAATERSRMEALHAQVGGWVLALSISTTTITTIQQLLTDIGDYYEYSFKSLYYSMYTLFLSVYVSSVLFTNCMS